MTRAIKMLACIYCDKEFEHMEIFISHLDNKDIVDCSACLKCVDRVGSSDTSEKVGGWTPMQREYDQYNIVGQEYL